MALAHAARSDRHGIAKPRIAPPVPARSLLAEYEATAADLGITLMPWQRIAARYMTATVGKSWRWRSVCIVVARQNGKTELLLPRIVMGLRQGRRILHTAHNRMLPRDTFLRLASALNGDPDVVDIRFANGQEVIRYANGGRYTLVAPRPRVRGHSVDDVLIDEVREQHAFDLMAAIKPTLTASRNPQIIYLSNAGDSSSVVLNDLREKADSDPDLAYLEWSASPDRDLDDRRGWAEANPALGTTITEATLAGFRTTFPGPVFETEHLCRWVVSMQPKLVDDGAWLRCHADPGPVRQPSMGIAMDPSGKRASAVIAWPIDDTRVGIEVVADVTGDPIDVARFGPDLRKMASTLRVRSVWFDPWTDADLARYLPGAKAVGSRDHGAASGKFATLVESGNLRWERAAEVTADLPWTARDKAHDGGQWQAVRAKEGRPVTAALAAVRAVWLPSGPRHATPKVM
jgi:hypothetical protein